MLIGEYIYYFWFRMEVTQHVDILLTRTDGYVIVMEMPMHWWKCVPIGIWLSYILTQTKTWRSFYFPLEPAKLIAII